MDTVDLRLSLLGINLPEATVPVANYVSFCPSDRDVHFSGQLSIDHEGGIKGVVGHDLDILAAKTAARLCGLNLLAQIGAAAEGDFERVEKIVRLGVFVQAAKGFVDIPQVANGCSDLMVEVFGDRGKHARSAVGVCSLPLGFAVEVEAVVSFRR